MEFLSILRKIITVTCVLLCFVMIWDFSWFIVKAIVTLAFINFLIKEFMEGYNDNDDDNDFDNRNNSSEKRNRFQEKMNQKIAEANGS